MKIIAKFTNSDGKVTTATFDRATGTVVSDDGRKGTYKREGSTLEISRRSEPHSNNTGQHSGTAHGRLHGTVHLLDRHEGDDDYRFCWLNG